MQNLAFVGNSESPATLLNMWKKQTPGNSGVWGELRGVDNYKDADVFAVVDRLPPGSTINPKKCVFLGAHPETMSHIYRDMTNIECLAKADCLHTPGFLEWWIDVDYDTLKALKPMEKPKPLGCVMSNNSTNPSHKARLSWLRRFTDNRDLPFDPAGKHFDLYGRVRPWTLNIESFYRGKCGVWDGSPGGGHMPGKEEVYKTHKYMLEFDVVGENYFSERILDCMLLWAMPIYYGCPNLHKYLPPRSFRYLNINGEGDDVLEIVGSKFYEQNIKELGMARNILLDQLQLWPRVHQLIFGRTK